MDHDLLRYARLFRDLGEGRVRFSFVHVLPSVEDAMRRGQTPRSFADVRSELHAMVTEQFGEVAVADVPVLTGPHLDKLLAAVADAGSDLVMVGHRRSARGRRSSSRRLAMNAPCSVCMVPEGSGPRISAVLAATDFSQPSAHAVSLATLIARRAGHETCTVVHVLEPSAYGSPAAERQEIARAFDRFLAPLDLHGVQVQPVQEESRSVAAAVARLVDAGRADLVVLGTRGRGPSAAALLGSESEQVLLESTVPVVVTKDRGERLGILSALLDRKFRGTEPQFG
ncbi:MAG: universal stress protein [Candidatus Binatia bacterium]